MATQTNEITWRFKSSDASPLPLHLQIKLEVSERLEMARAGTQASSTARPPPQSQSDRQVAVGQRSVSRPPSEGVTLAQREEDMEANISPSRLLGKALENQTKSHCFPRNPLPYREQLR